MPNSKVKNLIILILVLTNLALLALVLPARIMERQEEKELKQSLSDLYAAQKLELAPSIIPNTTALYALELPEDPQAELQAASALLGDMSVRDDSQRSFVRFSSALGSCRISRTGHFLAELSGAEAVKDISADTAQLLRRMNYPYTELSAGLGTEYMTQITAPQSILGVPVFSDGLTFTYENQCLRSVEGTYYPCSRLLRLSETACMTAADALVAFLSQRYSLGWVGTRVTGMTQGYLRADNTVSSVIHLYPVWRLETDTASYDINAISGEISLVSN